MNRRTFTQKSLHAASLLGLSIPFPTPVPLQKPTVRLGGPVYGALNDPDSWIAAHQQLGYRAAYCPLKTDATADVIKAYELAARKADIIIAEVGAWSNPLSPDPETAKKAFTKCVDSLALAEAIGANCCVNIAGSKNPTLWAGPHKDNMSDATFEQIVDITRRIINEIKPTRTYFTLEFMPWIHPDSVDSNLRLIKSIGHKQFAVHLDPVNIVNSPRTYYSNGEIIKDCFKRLGSYIRSCHGKDIILKEDANATQLSECRPGEGQLDYHTYLTELSKLKDIPLMLEHLPTAEEYVKAASYVRSIGTNAGITL